MVNYVMGLLFSPDRTKVCLMLKNKPDFLKGKLNGLGGKIEPGETASAAIVREVYEEAGVYCLSEWKYAGAIFQDTFNLYIYRGFSNQIFNVQTMEDEEVGIYDVDQLHTLPIKENLQWIIPLLLDPDAETFTVYYK